MEQRGEALPGHSQQLAFCLSCEAVLLLKALNQNALGAIVGFGTDPGLQIDIIAELDLVNMTLGVTQVSGLHNASKAFLFQAIDREIHAAPHTSEKLIQLFRNKSEFTFLATLQQQASSSGVILSIREMEQSFSSYRYPMLVDEKSDSSLNKA
ncbi:hypothetical protein JRQ81_000518 [Phrynocephalus forsythii]|uniref:Uncharacterized protein n=1 Tax=Phrynocephalus forsythii TaxID=171643 RepID=A0A9Q1B735_9SAUR|nr:hypothetical protein JRQ81_000518 [Phrynocephalus forsythii]